MFLTLIVRGYPSKTTLFTLFLSNWIHSAKHLGSCHPRKRDHPTWGKMATRKPSAIEGSKMSRHNFGRGMDGW
jgi:hypothetical protein